MRTNHLLLSFIFSGVAIASGAAFVVACSSSSNPAPATTPGEDGSASSSGSSSGATSSGTASSSGAATSSGSSSGTASSSGGASSSSSSGGGSSSGATCPTYDGGEGACNNCAFAGSATVPPFCAADAGASCQQDPYNACSTVTTCIKFTGTLPSPFPMF